MRLYDAEVKQKLYVVQILDKVLSQRLKDFGFSNGAKIEIFSKTKEMFLVKINNSLFAVNESLAKLILVKIDIS